MVEQNDWASFPWDGKGSHLRKNRAEWQRVLFLLQTRVKCGVIFLYTWFAHLLPNKSKKKTWRENSWTSQAWGSTKRHHSPQAKPARRLLAASMGYKTAGPWWAGLSWWLLLVVQVDLGVGVSVVLELSKFSDPTFERSEKRFLFKPKPIKRFGLTICQFPVKFCKRHHSWACSSFPYPFWAFRHPSETPACCAPRRTAANFGAKLRAEPHPAVRMYRGWWSLFFIPSRQNYTGL